MKNNRSAKALELHYAAAMHDMRRERHEEAEKLLLNSIAHLRSALTVLKNKAEYDMREFRDNGGQIVKGEEADVYLLGNSSLERVKSRGSEVKNILHSEKNARGDIIMLMHTALAESDLAMYDKWTVYLELILGEFLDCGTGGIQHE